MSETKHTPGPWRVGRPGPNGCPLVGTERGVMTAMVPLSLNHPAERDRAVADARLIAAAPDLLAACEEVAAKEGFCIYGSLELAQTTDLREAYQLGSAHAFEQCVEMVRTAIAKATEGEAA